MYGSNRNIYLLSYNMNYLSGI
jgi:hypothetical protein